jgi:acyl-CoA thioesterase I
MKRAPSPWSYPMLLRALCQAAIAAAAALAPVAAGVALAAQEGTTSDATLPDTTLPDAGVPQTGGAVPGDPAASEAAGAPAARASEPLAKRCASPEEIAPDQERIEGVAAAVAPGEQPLLIVVLGSLSGQDVASRGPAAFAPQLQEILQAELAARGVRRAVEVRHVGKLRAMAADLARLVDREVLPLNPALVIWQTSRSDPRQGNPPHRFAQGLKDGISRLRKAGIPVIVGDIQFHPQFEALFRTDDYRNYVRWVAGKHDLPLLRRHEMIEHWAQSARIDLDSGDDADQKAAYGFIQECLAYQATRMILGAAGLAPVKRE